MDTVDLVSLTWCCVYSHCSKSQLQCVYLSLHHECHNTILYWILRSKGSIGTKLNACHGQDRSVIVTAIILNL